MTIITESCIIAIIPARMGSARFPGKPMADILGTPMIGHVYKNVVQSKSLTDTYVATCDEEIKTYIESIGGKAIMTSVQHERCSDRCAEAMMKIEKEMGKTIDIVVMVQGDEPMVHPSMIDEAIQPILANDKVQIVNLVGQISSIDEFEDPNEVKVVMDKHMNALYFSREPIPSRKKGVENVPMFKQICIIPYRRDYLIRFNNLEPTPLEEIESVDMMRVLEYGDTVHLVETMYPMKSVDTKEDLREVCRLLLDQGSN